MNDYEKYLIDRISYHTKTIEQLLANPLYLVENEELWLETIHLHIKRIEAHTYHLMTDIHNQKNLEYEKKYTKADYEAMQND